MKGAGYTKENINSAYKKLALKLHPDKREDVGFYKANPTVKVKHDEEWKKFLHFKEGLERVNELREAYNRRTRDPRAG